MGIIIDIALVCIILISAFLGYKKGLVELGAKLFAGIIAIIITIIVFKPISNIIINNTGIDEKIEKIILEKTSNVIDTSSNISDNEYVQNATNNVTEQVKENILPEQAKNIAINVIYVVTALIVFIASKIILSIIIALANCVASLPILKQFNEVGGLAYGIVRGALIAGIIILLIGIITKINPTNQLNDKVQSSYLTKTVYNLIVRF